MCVTLAKLTPEIELKVENWLIRDNKKRSVLERGANPPPKVP